VNTQDPLRGATPMSGD